MRGMGLRRRFFLLFVCVGDVSTRKMTLYRIVYSE
jgi:hypothetical protein